ncbi:MAG: hypothetical protein IT419_00475 [Planctomycetes bacterium]|nr:hypothetical protein [Planctomycetota bacterium]
MLDQEQVPSPARLRHISNLALEVVSTLEETFLVSDMTAPPGFPRYADSELFLPCRTLARELKPENLWSDGPPSILVAGWPLALGRSLDWLRGAFLELLKTLRLEPLMTLARPSLSRQDKGPVLGIPKDPSSPFYNEPICVGKDWPPKVDRTLVESIRAAAHGVLEIVDTESKSNGGISSRAVVTPAERIAMVERFIQAVEAFRQKRCDPDHPEDWLTPERKFYDEYYKASENLNALIDMLVPKIGVDESRAIMHRLAELVSRLCRFIQRAKQHEQSGATDCRENDLRDIRNAQRDANFERVYEALRCGVASQTIFSNGSPAATDIVPNPSAPHSLKSVFVLSNQPQLSTSLGGKKGKKTSVAEPTQKSLRKRKVRRRKPLVKLHEKAGSVSVDGIEYRLNGEHAPCFIRVLLQKMPERVKATDFAKLGIRADRVFKSLPAKLRACISKPGRGQTGYSINCRTADER